MNGPSRRGFTLVEILVVVVLGSFLLLSLYQVLISNSRTYAVNNANIQGQQSLRAGLDVLFGELREISPASGDLIAMGPGAITFRAQRSFGLVCATNYLASPPQVTVRRVGPMVEAGDSVFVFADNDPNRASDDVWLHRRVQTSDSTVTCSGSPAQLLGITDLGVTGDTVRLGAPVRAHENYTYGLYAFDGESYLGRKLSAAAQADLLVGPLLGGSGVSFRYLDSLGVATTVNTRVAQIEVTLRYQSPMRDARNQPVADSVVARVFPRN